MRSFLLMLFFVASFAQAEVIGKWYDDMGSPSYLDSKIAIEKEGKKYFYHRVNGDGSSGRFMLIRSGNSYKRADGKFGSLYVVTPSGLELHDRMGYIRTAKPR
jgi:hypothetical protein